MVRERRYRTPCVIAATAAVFVVSEACSNDSEDSSTGGTAGAAATGGSGATGGAAGSGGLAGSAAMGGYAATGGTRPDGCPIAVPGEFDSCPPEGTVCKYAVPCQSGLQQFEITCGDVHQWHVVAKTCDNPYDSCPGEHLFCNDKSEWIIDAALHPYGACPASPPALGAPCISNQLGQVYPFCGYPCAGGGWSVYECAPYGSAESAWTSDGACAGDAGSVDAGG